MTRAAPPWMCSVLVGTHIHYFLSVSITVEDAICAVLIFLREESSRVVSRIDTGRGRQQMEITSSGIHEQRGEVDVALTCVSPFYIGVRNERVGIVCVNRGAPENAVDDGRGGEFAVDPAAIGCRVPAQCAVGDGRGGGDAVDPEVT